MGRGIARDFGWPWKLRVTRVWCCARGPNPIPRGGVFPVVFSCLACSWFSEFPLARLHFAKSHVQESRSRRWLLANRRERRRRRGALRMCSQIVFITKAPKRRSLTHIPSGHVAFRINTYSYIISAAHYTSFKYIEKNS